MIAVALLDLISLPVTVKSPATAAFAPLKVIAVALLDLISLPVIVRSSPTVASPAIATEELAIVACGVMVRWVT